MISPSDEEKRTGWRHTAAPFRPSQLLFRYIEDKVIGGRPERTVDNNSGLIHARLGPVAHAVREDVVQAGQFSRRKRYRVVAHVDGLQLALEDVRSQRATRHIARERERREQGIALRIG